MKFAFELPQAQAEKLRDEAERLGVGPEELTRAALVDLLGTPDAEFRAAATRNSAQEPGAVQAPRLIRLDGRQGGVHPTWTARSWTATFHSPIPADRTAHARAQSNL